MAIISLSRTIVNPVGDDPRPEPGPDHYADDKGPAEPRDMDAAGRLPSREMDAPQDEGELIRRLAASDVGALTVISEWLWEPLAAYAYRIVEDQDAAADIAQEACMRLWHGRDSTPLKSLRPYLFRITRNLALDRVKTRRTRRRLLRFHRPDLARHARAPDEELDRDRVSDTVQRAIQALPERRREVFSLTYLRGLSYAEVGTIMGISPKTVQNHMTAALTQLRETLRPLIDERQGPPNGPGRTEGDDPIGETAP